MKHVLLSVFALTLASPFALADTVKTPGDTYGTTGNTTSSTTGDSTDSTPGDSPRFDVSFEQIDADGNGIISEEEAAASGIDSAGFQHLDKNGDGELSREELLGVSRNEDAAPGNYNPGNSAGREVDPGTQRSNELSPTDRQAE